MDLILLQEMIDQKYINKRKHPTADLYIYNYSNKCQFDNIWNDITKKCRGLIMDDNNKIIARPFEKFFNLDENTELPLLPYEIFDKLDGSLGILYWIEDTPFIATRGSFESEQANWATKILHEKYSHLFSKLDRSKTYLFEIIVKWNKIVVNYGDTEDLILIGIIDTKSGIDVPLIDIGFPLVKKYEIIGIKKLINLNLENKEGFVIKFSNGFRVKIKFEEYVRLHRLITGVSNTVIWRYLKDNLSFDELVERVPDEWHKWLLETRATIGNHYSKIEHECLNVFRSLAAHQESRKDIALFFQEQKYPSVLFAMLDKKDYTHIIWKIVEPKWEKPFNKIEDN